MATLSARLLTLATFASLSSSSCASSSATSKTSGQRLTSVFAAVFALLLLGAPVLGRAQNASLAGAQATASSGQLSSPQAKARPDGEAAHRGLSSLPAAAQGSISAALGRDDSRYWLHGAAGSFHAENPQH